MTIPAGVVTAIKIFSTIATVVGAIQQGKAAQSQADLQAGILQQQGTRERQQAEADESDFRRNQSRILAARRAAGGASGRRPSTTPATISNQPSKSRHRVKPVRPPSSLRVWRRA